MAAELKTYIEKARNKKLKDEQIKNSLLAVGWQEEQIAEALSIDPDLPVPPPPPFVAHVGMWTGFLYIIFFISLYVLATAVSGILHLWVDKAIPTVIDNANTTTSSDFSFFFPDFETPSVIRGYIAAIIVSFPLFIVLAFVLKRQLVTQPIVRNLRSRKLLIYITLIITFLILLGNIITICYDLLAGTVTGNGLGHLGVTLLIVGAIFTYFIGEVKNDRKS
ncbi:MAG TPA: DUF5671 domain-containing protein [Candidatus Saccharimonadales bacterium]|nr:DUF5671 domain-containing protein [Candidatus Saccharimonadales bacterium]